MNVDTQRDTKKSSEMAENREFDASVGSEEILANEQTDGLSADLSKSEERILKLEDELQDSKDRFLRNLAEMDNMRRRHEKERQDLLKYASEKLLQDLLPVLDSFEKATSVAGSHVADPFFEGLVMVRKQLSGVLEQHGLKALDALGKPFDPNFHQAIQRIELEELDQETVKDEFQRGYLLNGRLIRPSMVSVYVPKVNS